MNGTAQPVAVEAHRDLGGSEMLRVPISEAQPGMKLATAVLHPRTGHRLLSED